MDFQFGLHRHNLLHKAAPEASILHRQSHLPLRGNLLPDHPRLLPSLRLRRKNNSLHFHSRLIDCLLPPFNGDNPGDVDRAAADREVFAVHDDHGLLISYRHSYCLKSSLPDAYDAPDARLGQEALSPHPPKVSLHAKVFFGALLSSTGFVVSSFF